MSHQHQEAAAVVASVAGKSKEEILETLYQVAYQLADKGVLFSRQTPAEQASLTTAFVAPRCEECGSLVHAFKDCPTRKAKQSGEKEIG